MVAPIDRRLSRCLVFQCVGDFRPTCGAWSLRGAVGVRCNQAEADAPGDPSLVLFSKVEAVIRGTQSIMAAGRSALCVSLAAVGLLAGGAALTASVAAEPAKASGEAEASAIESQLLDLQVQAGVMKSLQGNAQPVDTGVLAEREMMMVAPGRQDANEIARIDGEIQRLAARYRKLTGRGAGILPQGVEARQVAAATFVVHQPAPAMNTAPQAAAPAAGGWGGTTTVSPTYGSASGVAGAANQPAVGGGWGAPPPASPWARSTGAGAGAPPVYGQGNPAYANNSFADANDKAAAGGGPATPENTNGGWGDTSEGRVGEVLPPGVPYPGSENGGHSQALASLEQARRQPAAQSPFVVPPTTPSPGASAGSNLQGPEAAYEQAYGYLLQQDYGAAQFAFREFLTRYPKSPLAGNAQYWLGEIHYVQGQYKDAARAFLLGYERYGDGHKAADTLLKLALSLDKLNQPKAACSSLSEFFKRYGQAGDAPVEEASQARQRLRCPS
jgi:tol-pal system protein YbgF